MGDTTAGGGTPRRGTLNALQGLRGLAALLVVVDHSISTLATKAGSDSGHVPLGYFSGALGVQVFFVISGFVMMLSHGTDFGKPGRTRVFMEKRLGRIVPLYWLTTLIYWVKQRAAHQVLGFNLVLLSLLFIPHQEPDVGFGKPVYALGWTLEYEMAFYLVFAIGLLFIRRIGMGIILGFFGALVALTGLGVFGTDNAVSYVGQPIVLYFMAGVLIGYARNELMNEESARPDFLPTMLIVIGLAVITYVTGAIFGLDNFMTLAVRAGACVLAVAVCAIADESDAYPKIRFAARHLGDATYSIYLTHAFLVGPAGRIAGKVAPHLPDWAFVLIMLPICTAFGIVVYRFVERPIVRAIGKRISRPPAVLPASERAELAIEARRQGHPAEEGV